MHFKEKSLRFSSVLSHAHCLILSLLLTGCFHPPFNDFKQNPPKVKHSILGTGALGAVGILTGVPGIGFGIGAAAGALIGIHKDTPKAIIAKLESEDIQFIQYGDTRLLIIPTDHYFEFNSTHLNNLCYQGLNDVIKLLKLYPCSQIYIAAFTDSIGSKRHKNKLSQGQAEAMLTFLWANDIKANLVHAEGYGDKFDIGDNKLTRGSAFNRRIEIEWTTLPNQGVQPKAQNDGMK